MEFGTDLLEEAQVNGYPSDCYVSYRSGWKISCYEVFGYLFLFPEVNNYC